MHELDNYSKAKSDFKDALNNIKRDAFREEMNFIICIVIYLLGCLIAQIMLDKLGIDREEWKYKWLSWILVITLLMRDN